MRRINIGMGPIISNNSKIKMRAFSAGQTLDDSLAFLFDTLVVFLKDLFRLAIFVLILN